MKLLEFMEGELGIKIVSGHNLRQQMTKVNKSIEFTYEDRTNGGVLMGKIIPLAPEVFALMVLGTHVSTTICTAVGNQPRLRTAV